MNLNIKIFLLFAGLVFYTTSYEKLLAQTQKNNYTFISNGSEYFDMQGNIINAHGGGFLKIDNYYYWIGENRKNGVFVSCYRSKDLLNWEFRGDLLTRESHPELDKANI